MLGWLKKIWATQTLSFGAVMVIVTLLVLMVMIRSKPGIDKKQVLKYSLLMILVFGLCTIFVFTNDSSVLTNYILIQVFSLLMGIAHCWLMYIWFKWTSRDSFWPEMWFTTFITLLACTAFMLFGTYFMFGSDPAEKKSWVLWFGTGFIPFLIPYFVLKSFDFNWSIPQNQYKLWYHPLTDDIPDPMQYDLADHMKVIAIELDPNEKTVTKNIKVKAPERMELGHYFMSFIEQYNLRNPEEPIELRDSDGMAQGWIFYLKTKWYKSAKVFDADMTFNDNTIRENDTIVAERVKY
jgi:hypothetical protein